MNNHGKVFTISDANQLESDSIIPKRNKLLNSKQSDDTITTKKISNSFPYIKFDSRLTCYHI